MEPKTEIKAGGLAVTGGSTIESGGLYVTAGGLQVAAGGAGTFSAAWQRDSMPLGASAGGGCMARSL